MGFASIVVAAGGGTRAGGDKQWRDLGGRPVVRWSVEALSAAGANPIVIVVADGEQDRLARALSGLSGWTAIAGGRERADSVRAGLETLAVAPDTPVLIHDAARPFLTTPVIARLLAALDATTDGVVPIVPVADTLKRTRDGAVVATVDRQGLARAQTPQAFRFTRLLEAYRRLAADHPATDDAGVVEADGGRVVTVAGDPRLEKLTYPEDFAMAETQVRRSVRVGTGYDVHRWGPGGSVWLCGVEVPHDRTLIGHSDADAGLHALTDAILGALAEGDIGDHFPPSDPRWKGASSDRFLDHAARMVAERGGRVVHVDVTLICERPKVKPHRQAMRERIADILGLPLDRVSVKATTSEGLGFTGRDEGLAAQAVATLELPEV